MRQTQGRAQLTTLWYDCVLTHAFTNKLGMSGLLVAVSSARHQCWQLSASETLPTGVYFTPRTLSCQDTALLDAAKADTDRGTGCGLGACAFGGCVSEEDGAPTTR